MKKWNIGNCKKNVTNNGYKTIKNQTLENLKHRYRVQN